MSLIQFQPLLGEAIQSDAIQSLIKSFGAKPEVDDFEIQLCYSFPRAGVVLNFVQNHLDSVMLYGEGLDGFSMYSSSLPFGLDFGDSKKAVVGKVGSGPSSAGSLRTPFPGKPESDWIKFRFEGWDLHVEFKSAQCEMIKMITIMRPRNLPRLN
jgi:hypothetical protein